MSDNQKAADIIREAIQDHGAMLAMHLAVENVLIEWRDSNLSEIGPANGFAVKSYAGEQPNMIRFGTRTGLKIALNALADYLETHSER